MAAVVPLVPGWAGLVGRQPPPAMRLSARYVHMMCSTYRPAILGYPRPRDIGRDPQAFSPI